ncbi:hypothetical protein WA158_003795 [Blastocystis sp. Blastoise]
MQFFARTLSTVAKKPKILVTRKIPQEAMDMLLKANVELVHWDKAAEAIPRDKLLQMVKGCDGAYVLLTEKINDEFFEAAGPQLKTVATMSVGFDHFDLDACKKRGILCGYTPGVLHHTVAELTMALLLCTSRRLPTAINSVKQGTWGTWEPLGYCGVDLKDRTVGIVGMGEIGYQVAKRLSGWGCRIVYSDPRRVDRAEKDCGAEYLSQEELLKQSDFVTIHCALNKYTKNLMNMDKFKLMKPSAIFINTSRGPVVNQADLTEALQKGIIGGAGLDVTCPEPMSPNDPLLKMDNVVILPHIASASIRTRTRMGTIASECVLRGVFEGKVPQQWRVPGSY